VIEDERPWYVFATLTRPLRKLHTSSELHRAVQIRNVCPVVFDARAENLFEPWLIAVHGDHKRISRKCADLIIYQAGETCGIFLARN